MIHTIKPKEMFLTFNLKSVSYTVKDIRHYRKFNDRLNFAMHLFCVVLERIVDDIIENGTEFQFSANGIGSLRMWMKRITGRRYIAIRRKGAFKDFDPIETDFNAYRIELAGEITSSGKKFSIPVHLDPTRNTRIVELAKNHKIKAGRLKTYTDYYNVIEKEFPLISHSDIYKIFKFGFDSFRNHIFHGADIGLRSPSITFQTGLIYKKENSMLKYVLKKLFIKIRIMYRRYHFLWDGYSYFTLCASKYDAIIEDFNNHKVIDFGEVMLHKCPDEAFVDAHFGKAMFKVKAGDPTKKFANREHVITDEAELIEVFPKQWTLDMLNLANHKYMTIFPKTESVLKVYKQNYKPYIHWLRAKRWKEFRR